MDNALDFDPAEATEYGKRLNIVPIVLFCMWLGSTVMLWLQTNKAGSGMMNLGGSLMRQKEQDASLTDSTHIANIGRMVEEMENQIRHSLNTIYFDKTKSILNSLRSPVDGNEKAKREALKGELMSKVPTRQLSSNE